MGEDGEIPQEFRTNIQCPSCGKDMYLIYYRTDIAYEEGISIETYYCKSCLFKQNSIVPVERGDPSRISLTLRSPDDLRVVVYRSSEAVVNIPEIEAEIIPGKSATGEITTVEGILNRIMEKLQFMGRNSEDPQRFEEVRNELQGILNGGKPDLTLVIEDQSGKSKINSSRAQKSKLEQ